MTLFEYLAIAFSLVFSFSAARLVAGLPHALRPERRYSLHILLVVNLLLGIVIVFWAFWSFRDVEWNLVRFFLALASPGLLYFLACTAIPEAPESVPSWREHFYTARRPFFLGLAAWVCVVALNNTISLGIPILHPARALQLLLLALALVAASTSNPKAHGAIAIGLLVAMVSFFFLTFLPDALAA